MIVTGTDLKRNTIDKGREREPELSQFQILRSAPRVEPLKKGREKATGLVLPSIVSKVFHGTHGAHALSGLSI